MSTAIAGARSPSRSSIHSYLRPGDERTLADDVLDGLTRPFKELPPKHFYDARGADLFDRICELPEYYPTRAERSILVSRAAHIAQFTGAAEIVELGSGTAEKTRVLLAALDAAGTLRRYVPLDVTQGDGRALRARADASSATGSSCTGSSGDFERHLEHVPPPSEGPRIVAFLGGTIGNFTPGARRRFLRRVARAAAAGRRPPAARHRPRQGPARAGGGVQRLRRRHGGVQPQRPARDQPRARRRLRRRGLRARRVLRRRARVDRDAPALDRAPAGQRPGRRARGGVRTRARSCARRSARSSPRSGWSATSRRRGWSSSAC